MFTTYIHPSLHCSSRSASVSADWAALILLLNIHQDLLLFQWFVDQWHTDNRTIIHRCTIMQVQESPHEYLWEQTLRKKEINLCCVSQKTVAALWNINTWIIKNIKKTWACCCNVWGFSCISIRILFFCLQLHMSCMWHYHTEISNPSTHITSEAAKAPSGFLWCFLRFSHIDSPSQIKVFDIPYGLGLSKRHVLLISIFVWLSSKTCTISIFYSFFWDHIGEKNNNLPIGQEK